MLARSADDDTARSVTTDAPPTTGRHYVTNFCTDVEATRAFYEEVRGFHTAKMTENYDDPGTLHYFSSTPRANPEPRLAISSIPTRAAKPILARATTSPSASRTETRSRSGATT